MRRRAFAVEKERSKVSLQEKERRLLLGEKEDVAMSWEGMDFIRLLDAELEKFNNFFMEKEEEYIIMQKKHLQSALIAMNTKLALYEAFGLTVVEAISCGLPTFATNQGGPAEIIVDGVSGFHINPTNGDESSNKIAYFFEKCKQDTGEMQARHWILDKYFCCRPAKNR